MSSRRIARIFLIFFVPLFLPTGLLAGGSDAALSANVLQQHTSLSLQGKPLFQKYCSHCHGISGQGDGFNAEYLDKEPADLSDHNFIGKKTNHQMYRVIKMGGAAIKKSHLMPVFGGTLSEMEIWSLVAYIRDLAEDETHPVLPPEGASAERPEQPSLTNQDITAFSTSFSETGSEETLTAHGHKLFIKKKSCLACHSLGEEGGRVGPDLSRAGSLYPPEWLYAWIKQPHEFRPESIMPNLMLNENDAQALVKFLSSLPERENDENENEVDAELKSYLETEGDPEHGKKIFNDPEGVAYCSKCHRVAGQGGEVGPDLSRVGSSRTRWFLLESLLDPSAVITSGFATLMILTKERQFITGIKKNEDENSVVVVDKEGKVKTIAKDTIKKFKTQKISTMPSNFKDLLNDQDVADLLAYLQTLTHPIFAREN
jgi:putative heme-binding domain-containing protein